MRVAQITIEPYLAGGNLREREGRPPRHEGIAIVMHYGWYASLMLEGSTAEFDKVKTAAKRTKELRLPPRSRHDVIFVEVHDLPLVKSYVERGALTNTKFAVQLAKELERMIRDLIGD